MKAQDVSAREHVAFKCVICGTIQSMASLIRAGATPDEAEKLIGFSCEGRLTDAGPWPNRSQRGAIHTARRKVRGCDWTLGGLFRIHKLEVINAEGKKQPSFEIATKEEAQALVPIATAQA